MRRVPQMLGSAPGPEVPLRFRKFRFLPGINDTTIPWEQKNAGYKSTMSLSEAQYEEVVIPEIRGNVNPLDFSENRGMM